MKCPDCGSTDTRVVDSRPLANGDRRRRHKCLTCLVKWDSRWSGKEASAYCTFPPVAKTRLLSDDQARDIMLSTKSTLALAEQYGVSHQAISQMRLGQVYVDVYQKLQAEGFELAAEGVDLCTACKHWISGGCGFGFPDAGGDFATDCSLYEVA